MDQVRPPDSQFVAALRAAGMADVPEIFSVALLDQQIPRRILADRGPQSSYPSVS